jgi:RNA polymerase sigma-70 factor, ECF subfamily
VSESAPSEISLLLEAWSRGDQSAFERLVSLVYGELHRLAQRYMVREQSGRTLQTSALVNEAYLRLADANQVQWQNRAHFFAISAQVMRRTLVGFARSRGYQKRGGNLYRVSFDEAMIVAPEPDPDLIELDDALSALAAIDPRKAKGSGVTLFWRLERRRNGRGAESFARHGNARLAAGESLAGT